MASTSISTIIPGRMTRHNLSKLLLHNIKALREANMVAPNREHILPPSQIRLSNSERLLDLSSNILRADFSFIVPSALPGEFCDVAYADRLAGAIGFVVCAR